MVSLRSIALGFQTFCATICILLAITVFRIRRDKVGPEESCAQVLVQVLLHGCFIDFCSALDSTTRQAIAASRWIMLEMMLLGALLLYLTVSTAGVWSGVLIAPLVLRS